MLRIGVLMLLPLFSGVYTQDVITATNKKSRLLSGLDLVPAASDGFTHVALHLHVNRVLRVRQVDAMLGRPHVDTGHEGMHVSLV